MRTNAVLVPIICLLAAGSAQAQDSLNCREKGSWPFGPSYAVALDPARNLAFMGSGRGVYVFDVSNPAQPQKRSEAIHTCGLVLGLAYQANTVYVAAGGSGLGPTRPGRKP